MFARAAAGPPTPRFPRFPQVLQDVKAKAAPYYTQGPSGTPQWTNECREDLVQQCGSTVCGWAVQYKAALADNCNSSCPTGCPGTGAFASSLLQPANQGLLYAVITAESAVLSVQKKTPGSAEAARTAGEAKQDSPDLKKVPAAAPYTCSFACCHFPNTAASPPPDYAGTGVALLH